MQNANWPLVGRQAEIERLRSALTEPGRAGVVIVGRAGAGKTRLARWSMAHARELGLAPEWICGTTATSATALGAFAHILPNPAADPPERLLHAAHQAIRERSGGAPALLAVDDAHLLDDLSALLVHQLATSGATTVVVTLRSGHAAPEPLLDLWKDAHAVRVELLPLERHDVEELLTAVLGGPVDMALALRAWRISGGNPLYLRELVGAAMEHGLLHELAGTWCLEGELPASARLVDLVESRLAGLGDEARSALELVAVGEPLTLTHAGALIPLDILGRLEVDGLVRLVPSAGGELLQIADAVHGQVLRDRVPGPRARRLFHALAESLEADSSASEADRDRIARWRMSSGTPVEVTELVGMARRALAGFDVDLARRCAAEAYRAERSARCGIVLGQALVLAKEHHQAERIFAAVEDLAGDDEEIVACGAARADNLFHWLDRPEAALAANSRAEARAGSEDARRRVAFQRSWFDLYEGVLHGALAQAIGHLGHPDPDVAFEAAALGCRARMVSGRFSEALGFAERAEAAQRPTDRPPTPPGEAGQHRSGLRSGLGSGHRSGHRLGLRRTTEVFVLVHTGHPAAAIEMATAAHAEAIESGDVTSRGWFADLLGAAYLLVGRPATAERWYREAVVAMTLLGVDPRAGFAHAEVAHCLALRGDAAGARAVLAEVARRPGRRWRLLGWGIHRAEAWAAAAAGDRAGALALLTGTAAALARGEAHTYEAALLHDVVRLGGADPAVADRLGALCDLVEDELMVVRAAHGRAAVAADRAALEVVAGRFERMGALLLAAEVWAAAAEVARRGGAERDAVALERMSRDLEGRCEGARTPGLAPVGSAGGVALTAREAEVAALAAEGLASKAIAERLFLSARTVDNYLGRIFAKLGLTSRAGLTGALQRAGGTVRIPDEGGENR